jgi:hypothetical protein
LLMPIPTPSYETFFSLCPGTFSPYVQEHFLLMSRNIFSLCPGTFSPYVQEHFLLVSRNISSLCPGTFSPYVQEHFLLMSRNISSLCLRNIFLWEKYFHKGRKNVHRQREKNVSWHIILTDHIFENLFAIRCLNRKNILFYESIRKLTNYCIN